MNNGYSNFSGLDRQDLINLSIYFSGNTKRATVDFPEFRLGISCSIS